MLRQSRRTFLRTSGAAAAGVVAGIPRLERATTSVGPGDPIIKLGVATYSLREIPRPDAIAGIQAIGARFASIKSFHLPYEDSPELLRVGAREFEDAGIEIVSGGVIYLQEDDDDHMRRHFDYARHCGMPLMVIGPTRATLPRIERFVREYDIAVAIHNHGPEDEHFPAPSDALEVIRDMDPRVGVCVDVGHTTRTGANVVEEVAVCGNRLLDIHMKDLRDLSDGASQCEVGEGSMPVANIFEQLLKMGYGGYVNLEYEIDANDPVPGMRRSFAYMRGVVAGLTSGVSHID